MHQDGSERARMEVPSRLARGDWQSSLAGASGPAPWPSSTSCPSFAFGDAQASRRAATPPSSGIGRRDSGQSSPRVPSLGLTDDWVQGGLPA